MTIAPTDAPDHPDGETDRQADAMKVQLKKDVASWSAERPGALAGQAAELSVPAASQPSLQPAKRVKRTPPLPTDGDKAATATKKPFTMSYDGVSEADYITYMIARGAR
jgi:hypothetical protein